MELAETRADERVKIVALATAHADEASRLWISSKDEYWRGQMNGLRQLINSIQGSEHE